MAGKNKLKRNDLKRTFWEKMKTDLRQPIRKGRKSRREFFSVRTPKILFIFGTDVWQSEQLAHLPHALC